MLEQHRGRADKQRRLDEVLKAVGGVVTGGSLEGPVCLFFSFLFFLSFTSFAPFLLFYFYYFFG